MSAAKTIFIFEGEDNVTICRGEGLTKSQVADYLYDTKVKQKGWFTPFISKCNIDESFIGKPKKLMVGDKVTDFQVVKIRQGFLRGEPSMLDVPSTLIVHITSLRDQCDMWKRKYFEARRLNEDREQKDRFRGRVNDEFDFVAKQKNKFFGSGDPFGGIGRFGGYPMIGSQNQEDQQ